ncbi:MAG: hypothetical protein CL666_10935 [Balneola sp.]|nr:hypothetical protein [Balneola sp.]|tara:strand:- start:23436 stop:24089 length:654 start_codon:yes stop_codon:yes gene_type:complete
MSNETKLLIGAILAGSIAYLVPLYFGSIWLGYTLLLLITISFLGSLIWFARLNLESKISRRVVIGVTGTLLICNILLFVHDYNRKDYQKNILLEIRKILDTGIARSDVQKELTYVFSRYHTGDRNSVVETARDVMPERLGEDGIYLSEFDLEENSLNDDNTNYFYELDEEADELRVIVVTDVSRGENPEFKNYDGQVGRLEMEFTVNKQGVGYEVRN